jgi:hypothetical protein
MDGKAIVGLLTVLLFVALLMPVGMNAFTDSMQAAVEEGEALEYYNSLSDADKANYTSDYAEDGEPPTPWSNGETALMGIISLIAIVVVVRGMNE